MHYIKILYLHQRLVFGANSVVGSLFFGQPITAENYLNVLTQFIALLERMNESECWFHSKMAYLPTWQKQQLSHRTSMIAFAGIYFGYYDPLTNFFGAF
jgi:hypothetical protein